MSLVDIWLYVLAGLTFIEFIIIFVSYKKNSNLKKDNQNLLLNQASANEKLKHLEHLNLENSNKDNEIKKLGFLISDQNLIIKELETKLKIEKQASNEKLSLLNESKDVLKSQFKELASEIVENNKTAFSKESTTNLTNFLQPFREQVKNFQSKIEDNYLDQAKDCASLKQELSNIKELNLKITKEASNLTNALKNNNKTQGMWGEIVLENILDRSGLVKDRDYLREKSFTQDKKIKRPDVILLLPENRHIIIDAKVSLNSFQRFCQSQTQEEKNTHLNHHIQSITNHIDTLSKKDYSAITGLNSPEIVFLFMPVEPAFFEAFKNNFSILDRAFEKNIAVVTPSTLIPTLKIVSNLWKIERQNKSAKQLTDHAVKIYDKLHIFLSYLEELGIGVEKLTTTYDKTIKNLYKGKGNLISLTSDFKKFGIETKKNIPKKFLNNLDDN